MDLLHLVYNGGCSGGRVGRPFGTRARRADGQTLPPLLRGTARGQATQRSVTAGASPHASPICGRTPATTGRGRTRPRRRRDHAEVVGPPGRYVRIPEGKEPPPCRVSPCCRGLGVGAGARADEAERGGRATNTSVRRRAPRRPFAPRRGTNDEKNTPPSDPFGRFSSTARRSLKSHPRHSRGMPSTGHGSLSFPRSRNGEARCRSTSPGTERPPTNETPLRRNRVGLFPPARKRTVRYRFRDYPGRNGEARCRYRRPLGPGEAVERPE